MNATSLLAHVPSLTGACPQARLARAAADARVRHGAVRRARGAARARRALPRAARRPVGRRARAARHARRGSARSLIACRSETETLLLPTRD